MDVDGWYLAPIVQKFASRTASSSSFTAPVERDATRSELSAPSVAGSITRVTLPLPSIVTLQGLAASRPKTKPPGPDSELASLVAASLL